VKLKIDIIIIT